MDTISKLKKSGKAQNIYILALNWKVLSKRLVNLNPSKILLIIHKKMADELVGIIIKLQILKIIKEV